MISAPEDGQTSHESLSGEGPTDIEITTARARLAAKHKHPVNQLFHDEATLGERVADKASAGIGSWWFLGTPSVLAVCWVFINSVESFTHKWDLYPFILLSLMFSVAAAFTGSLLLLSGDNQAQKEA